MFEQGSDLRVLRSVTLCPKRPWMIVCDQDPETRFPDSCDSYGCEACGPRKALGTAAIAAWSMRRAERARLFTGTLAPDDWQARRQKMRNYRRSLQKRGYSWEVAWTTEIGSRTGMVHVHGLQHGSYIPQRVLEDVWGARVDMRAATTGGAATYVTKEALRVAGYVVKGATASASGLDQHLALNGGRAMHWSRGFLHGLDKREAATAMRQELNEGREARTWHRELATAAELGTSGGPGAA